MLDYLLLLLLYNSKLLAAYNKTNIVFVAPTNDVFLRCTLKKISILHRQPRGCRISSCNFNILYVLYINIQCEVVRLSSRFRQTTDDWEIIINNIIHNFMDTTHRGLHIYTQIRFARHELHSVFDLVDFPIIFFLHHYNIIFY